jgi:two-component system osmolarity sensor histidine kinase EnvZ
MFRALKKYLPESLFGRTLLILTIPTLIAQMLSVYIFYERHWNNISRHLALSLAGEVVTMTEYIEEAKGFETEQRYLNRSKNLFYFNAKLMSQEAAQKHVASLDKTSFAFYNARLKTSLKKPFEVYSDHSEVISTIVYLSNSALVVDVPYKRLFNSTSYIFIIWMVGSTFILLTIAVIFLKNQIRPIIRLARLADYFGRGQEAPANFKPEGAKEVKQAGYAFLKMQNRIKRYIKQRTDMLTGISHDLKTPLTRIKLDLAIIKQKNSNADFSGIEKDMLELERMVNSYLDFIRTDEEEEITPTDIGELVTEVSSGYSDIEIEILSKSLKAGVRSTAIKRVIRNLIENAKRFSTQIKISLLRLENNYILIIVDDNGQGIPYDKREDVFKPFFRIDDSRNTETGGVGLGLSVVRDIVNRHGGTVHIEDSPLNGTRVVVKLPV